MLSRSDPTFTCGMQHHTPFPVASASLRRYAGDYGAHSHGHAQILVGQRGRLELEVDGRAAFVDAGCGLVIPPGASHVFMARSPAQVLVVDAPDDGAWRRARRFVLPQAAATWTALPEVDQVRQVLDVARLGPRANRSRRSLDPDVFDAALMAALHEDWSTARMSALFCMSPQRFHARWLALAGSTPQQHLRGLRLARAAVLLRAGLGLEAVALQVGYASASALVQALQRGLGEGARAIRRRG